MAPDGKSSIGCPVQPRDIRLDDELNRSLRVQQSLRKGKERLLSPRGSETIKYPDKLKAENHLAPPVIRPHRERRQGADARSVHQKAFESRLQQSVRGKATADDELVKHMSNLPAYLQHIDKGENFKEKVLNVGVLDWTRLEKWKLDQKADIRRGGSGTSSSNGGNKSLNVTSGAPSLATALSGKTPTQRSDLKGPLSSRPGSFQKDDSNQYTMPANNKVRHSQAIAPVPKLYLNHGKRIPSACSSSGRNGAQAAVGERAKRKELSQANDPISVKLSAPVKRATELSKADIQNSDQEGGNVSEAGTSFYKSATWGEQMGPFCGEANERVEKAQESDVEVSHHPRHRKQKSIVLFFPKRFPQSSLPDMFKKNERTPSTPCLTEPNRSSFSDSFSSGVLHSGEIFSGIPRSCPLPSQVETPSGTISPVVESTSDASVASAGELQGFRTFKHVHGSSSEAARLDLAADLETRDRESPGPEPRRSRHPSPNRRFSFSLDRMARSFSFKETTSVPQLPTYVSAKSGPVTGDDSHCGHIANQEKSNPSTRGRSSPLRRLLNPLLKSRSMSSHHSSENIQPQKPAIPTGPLLHEKREKSIVQALLQLTVKNGNPLFKLVVDNNSDVLAATVSNSVSARKDGGPFRSCTFYSVNEIKKKSIGWIGQGNKAKGGGFSYNVVGQMKLSNSPYFDWTVKGLSEHIITTECILFGVDSRQADKQPVSTITNRELAATIFRFSNNENGDPNSVTVILPGGVHGLPKEGEPSPLINRWKSGGSCDCGGWDVGCKLQVLSNQNSCHKNMKTSKTFATSDHLELFAQGEPQSSMPIFKLTPFRTGIYSVEFDSLISLLQAFSISVAFISCQGPPDSVNILQEPRNGDLRGPMIFQREGPAKFAPCPPLSPVGRV